MYGPPSNGSNGSQAGFSYQPYPEGSWRGYGPDAYRQSPQQQHKQQFHPTQQPSGQWYLPSAGPSNRSQQQQQGTGGGFSSPTYPLITSAGYQPHLLTRPADGGPSAASSVSQSYTPPTGQVHGRERQDDRDGWDRDGPEISRDGKEMREKDGAAAIDGKDGTGKETKGVKKRKKKVEVEADSPPGDDKEKRTKTGRACDACRSKKIRCDILPATEWVAEEQPLCAHCRQGSLECTFFLPITETRFKKRKATEDTAEPMYPNTQALYPPSGSRGSPRSPLPLAEIPGRIEGPTSINFLLHTTVPAYAGEAFDLRHHHSWEVSEDGNGLIRVRAPPSATGYADADPDDPSKAHNRLNKPVLSAHMISLLVNAYFDHLAPLFPIISRAEFATKRNPSPLLLYSICGLGATMRQFPRDVFAGVRGVINGLLRSNDILSDARFEHVQALLLLSQVGDLHAQPTASTASASLIRMGTATRMAQDLGLHRESTLRAQTAQDLAYVELRRRVWASCVILDRWYGAALGIPLLVDLLDCDVLLPAPYDIDPDTEPASWPVEPHYVALSEHLKLTILIGRVLKTIYSPTGLKHATDAQLEGLLADMRSWHANLPETLRFKGNDSSTMAGLLHLSYTALHFLFWRVFMRIAYICPPHLKFGLSVTVWTDLVDWSGEALEWLSHHDHVLDTLFVFPYAATSCALMQYHNWARRRDPSALESLKLVRETAMRWEATVQPDQMSIRRKTCETMTLLYEAALKTNPEGDDQADRPHLINPIPGVQPRQSLGKSVWVSDPHRPGGGIWVARDETELAESGVSESSIVLLKNLHGTRQAPSTSSSTSVPVSGTRDTIWQDQRQGVGAPIGRPTLSASPVDSDSARQVPGPMDAFGPSQLQDGGQALSQPQQVSQRVPEQPMGPRAEFALQLEATPIQQIQMSGSNVNPQLNFDDGMIKAQPLDFSDPSPFDPSATFDPLLFEALSTSGFTSDQWTNWIDNIDRLLPAPDQGHGAPGGGPGLGN